MILIDPPSPFAPRKEWEAFLKEMEELLALNPQSKEVAAAIREARAALED